MRRILAVVCLAGILAACGRKGPLVPPESLVPAPVADLKVEQQGDGFLVSWSPPGQQAGGGRLTGLAAFRLLRREVLPPAEDCEMCPNAYRTVASVDLSYPRGVRRADGRWYYLDRDVVAGHTYQYRVVSVTADGSATPPGPPARRRLIAVLAPPHLSGEFSPVSVTLHWDAPALPAGAELLGFTVYRGGSAGFPPPTPLVRLAADEHSFEDLRVESAALYRYGVRSVVRVGGETVESPLSNEIAGTLAPPE